MKKSFILVFLAAALFITGCQTRALHPGGGCWRNRDCNDPELLCITSKCMNLACQQEGDCPFGYVCTEKGQDQICKQASCSTEVDCADGLTCDASGYCIEGPLPNGSACEAADDCASEHCVSNLCCENACADGTCNESGECVVPCDPECEENQSCVDGECVAGVDNCDPNPCANSGTCTDTGETYTCACATGWEGSTCTSATTGACSPNPCQNSGACADTGNETYECTCDNSWTGTNCDTADDDCSPNPCQNEGVCTDTGAGTYECACVGNWTGSNCETASGGGTKADGESCADGTECVSGHCADDVCCENACSDELSGSCNGSGTEGQCVQDLGTVCSDANDCGSPYCVGAGVNDSTTGFCCAQATCDAGEDCNNSSGVCGTTIGESCTEDGECSTGNCVDDTCCQQNECDAGSQCTTGTCLKDNGEACSAGADSACLSGACAWADSTGNGVGDTYLCCEGACTGGTCNASGVCVCSDGPCAGNQTCQSDTGYCACIPDCTGKVCGEDGCGGESCGTCSDPATCHQNRCIGPGAPASNTPDNIGCNNIGDCTDSTKPNCVEGSCAAVAESCAWLKTNHLARDGVYWIDVEGTPTRVYCDMELEKVICSEAGIIEHTGKTRSARVGEADTDTYPEYDDMNYRMQNILNPDTGHCEMWRIQPLDPSDGRPLARLEQWLPDQVSGGDPAGYNKDSSNGNILDTCRALGLLDNRHIQDCPYGPGGTNCGFSTYPQGDENNMYDFYGNACAHPDYHHCETVDGYESNVLNRGMTAGYRPLGPVGPATTGTVLLPGDFSGGSRAYCVAQINSTVNDGRFDTLTQIHNQNAAHNTASPWGGVITPLGPSGKSRWWAVGPLGGNAPAYFQAKASAATEALADGSTNSFLKMELISNAYIAAYPYNYYTYSIVAQPTCVPNFDTEAGDKLKLRARWRISQTDGWAGSVYGPRLYAMIYGLSAWPNDGVAGLDFTTWEWNNGSSWNSEAYIRIDNDNGSGYAYETEWAEFTADSDDNSVPLTTALSEYKNCVSPVLLSLIILRRIKEAPGNTTYMIDDLKLYVDHDPSADGLQTEN